MSDADDKHPSEPTAADSGPRDTAGAKGPHDSGASSAASDETGFYGDSGEHSLESEASGAAPTAFGRYEVRGLLGEGAFGAVYLGYDRELKREVAVKAPRVRLRTHQAEQLFLDEARRLAQLKHPGIVTVFDVGVDRGRCYIVSDYLPGQTLHAWLKAERPAWQDCVRIAAALADALAHAHAHRIIHRDLKPGNVILTEGRRPVIVDFGLAVSDAETGGPGRGVIVGTPAYMAPEQVRGEGHRIDGRTDIYALGVLLYRMLTGRLPFHVPEVEELLKQIEHDEPQPPRQLVRELPAQLERICLKAMAKQLKDRYLSAADMAMDLLNVLDHPLIMESSNVRTATLPGAEPRSGSSAVRRTARGAERRRLTVLQCGCDLFHSETILAALDADEQHDLLLDFQRLCRETAEKLEGTVVQATDHGLLICFGFPVAFEDAPRRAVRTGLRILEGMAPFNEQLQRRKGVNLSTVAAIHCDLAVVQDGANPGEAPSIIGQLLNVADQLERMAEPNTVVLSADTHRLVKRYFDLLDLGPKRLKGAAGEKHVFQVRGEHATASSGEAASAAVLTPLIGRDRETALLHQRWEQASEGRGQVVLLAGEAGIGKSRLVQTLKQHVSGHGSREGDPVIEWRCTPYHKNSSLYPAIEFFERVFAFGPHDAPAQKLDAIVVQLQNLNLGGDEEIALLASLLSVPTGDRYPPLELTPQRLKEKTLDLLTDLLEEFSRRRPVLFIVEDMHWVDPTTLEFLTTLVDQELAESILVLFTYRPDFTAPWKTKAHHTQVALTRLTKRQIGELMVLKSGVKKIPQKVVDQVADRTEGVPLFIEEFTAMVLESGTLREVAGEVEMSDSFPLHEIPASLQDLLTARLDRMASNIEVAQLAATIGREFTYDLLLAVTGLEEGALQGELAKLVDAELLHQRGRAPRVRYQFKHALIQDAAYQSLLKKKRQQFHQRIGEALEQRFNEISGNQPELLAYHFTEADVKAKAVEYWERAGERALLRSAHPEAIEHLTHGLTLLKTLPETHERRVQEVRMHIRLGVALQTTRGYSAPEVEANYAQAHALCQQIGETAQLFPVLYGLFRYYMLQAKYVQALELAEQLHRLAQRGMDLGYQVAAYRALGSALVYQGEHAQAVRHLEKALAIPATAELRAISYRYDVVDPWIAAGSYLCWSLWLLGYPERAIARSRQVIAEAHELDHTFSVALALNFGSWLHQFLHDIDAMREGAERARKISEEKGFAFWIGWSKVLGGWVRAERGESEEGIAEIRQGLSAWRGQRSELGRSYFLALLADACMRAGKITDGLEAVAEAEANTVTTGAGFWRAEIHRIKGELLLRTGPEKVQEAEQCFEQALETARRQQARSLELRIAMSLARLLRGRSDGAAALQQLQDIYGWFTEGLDTYDLQSAKALIDDLSGP